jgi:Bifunctional DNA primase/polymerase, N-terminal
MISMRSTLDYLDRGWSVLPLKPRAKVPAARLIRATRGTSSWSVYRDRHASPDEVAAWHELEPGHNVGILCGETSGNLAVVDVDSPLPAEVKIPVTATVRTGRGRQFYGRGEALTERFEWGELRSEGSYVVVPRSTHPNGRQYEWESSLDEIAPLQAFELPLASRARNLDSFSKEHPGYLSQTAESGLSGKRRSPRFPRFAFATCPTAEAAAAYAAVLGLPFERLGKTFPCCLHADEHPSATLWPHGETGEVLFHDFHARDYPWLWLPTLYAWLSGCPRESLTPSAYVTWARRLDIAAGIVAPAPVPRVELPVDASRGLFQLYDGFLRLFEARWLHTPGEPAPFSHRFAAVWCGCAKGTVDRGTHL